MRRPKENTVTITLTEEQVKHLKDALNSTIAMNNMDLRHFQCNDNEGKVRLINEDNFILHSIQKLLTSKH